MNKEIQVGDWSFEIVQIRARKTPKYGNPYTGICNITIVNGEPHIEGLLTTEPLTFNDVRSIKKTLLDMGFTGYKSKR